MVETYLQLPKKICTISQSKVRYYFTLMISSHENDVVSLPRLRYLYMSESSIINNESLGVRVNGKYYRHPPSTKKDTLGISEKAVDEDSREK